MEVKHLFKFAFPTVMVTIMAATLLRYGMILDFRNRSSEHHFFVESEDIDSVEKAIRGATFQDVKKERIAEDKYIIVVSCPPEKIGYIMGVIQKMGGKRLAD